PHISPLSLHDALPISLVTTYREYRRMDKEIAEAEQLLSDPEMKELAQAELGPLKSRRDELEEKIKLLLLTKDPNDDKNVILEIKDRKSTRLNSSHVAI